MNTEHRTLKTCAALRLGGPGAPGALPSLALPLLLMLMPQFAVAQNIEASDQFPPFALPQLSGENAADERTQPDRRRNEPLPIEDNTTPRRRLNDREQPIDEERILPPIDERDSSEGGTPLPPDSTFEDRSRSNTDERERGSLPTSDESILDDALDWTVQPVSLADLEIGAAWPFEHGKPIMNDVESAAYVALLRAVETRKLYAEKFTSEMQDGQRFRSAWETAFYRYEDVRRQAWANGAILLQSRSTVPADPFAPARDTVLSTNDRVLGEPELKSYSLRADMQAHPADFTGRPVVLYGLFTPSGAVELQAKEVLEGEQSLFRLQRGTLRNLKNTETLALVDAINFIDSETQLRPSTAWPTDRQVVLPVLIKGWFVKLWGQRPLIFTETARVLTSRPFDEHIRKEVSGRQRVSQDEAWLFYETLRQLQVTQADTQDGIAFGEQQRRVVELQQELREEALADLKQLDNELQAGRIDRADSEKVDGYDTRKRRLQRQVALREERYRRHLDQPETFPILVDVFSNPDRWHGRLMTVHGHVRRVTTFRGDATVFDGQPLHELWLYPDDSQNLPMVIVTPMLPADFPVQSDVIDAVTITGCFFKMYAYRAASQLTTRERHDLPAKSRERRLVEEGESLNRLAPLVLAGHVRWSPTTEQVLSLADAGHLRSDLPLVRTARAQDPRGISDTMLLLSGFLVLIATMTVWGRVQRDRRERQRLRSLVDERPDFRQTSQELYSGPFADSRIEPARG